MSEAIDSFNALNLGRLYRIYNTVHKMMADRKYSPLQNKLDKNQWISKFIGFISDLENPDTDVDTFKIIDEMSLLFERGDRRLLVYFYPLDSKLCQSDMNYIHKLMTDKKATNIIIVVNNKATPKVTSVLGILGEEAQLFFEDELVTNRMEHQLVPTHTLVVGEEREKILATFATTDGKVRLETLPGMYTNKPVAKYYGFKVDDLIRIERSREDGFVDLSYRIVIHPITDKDKKN